MSQVIYNLSDISTDTYPIFVLDPTKAAYAFFRDIYQEVATIYFPANENVAISFKNNSVAIDWIGNNLENLNIYNISAVSTAKYPIVILDPAKITYTKFDSVGHSSATFYFQGSTFSIPFNNNSIALEWIQDNLGETALTGDHNESEFA